MKATFNWDSEQIKLILSTAKNLKIPIVFHMQESEYFDISHSNALFDKVLFGGLTTNKRILAIPQRILRILVNQIPILQKRSKISYFFPGYMLDFASLEAALQSYPGVNFVAHGLLLWKHISDDTTNSKDSLPDGPIIREGIIWRLLQNYPNLYADISGPSGRNALVRDSRNAKKFLSLFEDKILYGTDNVMGKQRQFLDSLGLSEGTYKKIYGENASRIIDIKQ